MRTHINLRQLEAIESIAKHGSFSAAAGHLHVSQPALSRTVRLAEESLGTKLFDRGARNVTLTPAGAELLPIARRVLLEFGDSMSELAQFMEGRRGRVRVSALPSVARPVLVEAVSSFSAVHPEIEFQLRVDPAETVLQLLDACEIDMGITVQPPPDGRFLYQHLYDDEYVLICAASDPVATRAPAGRPLPWQIVEGRRFIAASRGSNTRGATDAAFTQAGISLRPAHEVASSDLTVIASLVASGLGLSVLPASALGALDQHGIVSRRLHKPRMKRKVGIVTRAGRTLSMATTRFRDQLLKTLLTRGG